ncbi:MAG: glutamine--tRNA ligase, partial [Deferribacterales bacterium]
EELEAINNPEDESKGKRKIPFSRELYIEKDDFRETAEKNFFRLTPSQEVRLQYAYYVTCTGFKKDDNGNIIEIYCEYDPESRGGWTNDGRKVKGTIHWVSAKDAINVELRLYEHLFLKENPEDVEEGEDFTKNINPNSLTIKLGKAEPFLKDSPDTHFQFLRIGYFRKDEDSNNETLVFNKTVGLKDSYKKR